MNIIEAIRSGKPFKRKVREHWVIHSPANRDPSFESANFIQEESRAYVRFTKAGMLSDDWEVKEEKLSLSFDEITDAYISHYCKGMRSNAIANIKKQLGFK